MIGCIVGGAMLGVLSRVEETTPGFSIGLSSNATWVALAFAAGALRRGAGAVRAMCAGVACLTTASTAYYLWVAITEPATALASVAGPPARWYLLGVAAGAVFGATGRLWAASSGARRLAASVPLAAVLIADGVTPDLADQPSDGISAAVGTALLLASARSVRARVVAMLAAAGLAALGLSGQLHPFLP